MTGCCDQKNNQPDRKKVLTGYHPRRDLFFCWTVFPLESSAVVSVIGNQSLSAIFRASPIKKGTQKKESIQPRTIKTGSMLRNAENHTERGR